jgi:hypothetical protein
MFKAFTLLLLSLCLKAMDSKAQVVFQHVSERSIYDYLDEAANLGFIELNSAVRPYSRMFVHESLEQIAMHRSELSQRQRDELEFYKKEYVKEFRGSEKQLDFLGKGLRSKKVFPFKNRSKRYDLFFYSDTNFTLTVNPIIGGEGWYNQNGFNMHRFYGAEMQGYVWKIGFYGNYRDNSELKYISDPVYLTQRSGSFAKGNVGGSRDYSETRGGLTISHKGVTIGIVKDHVLWGNNYNGSNIHGGRNPSFPMILLKLKPVEWFEVNYFHGWLFSGVLDSTRTIQYSTGTQKQYIPKFIAANLYTFRPFKKFYFSVGNSVVYSGRPNPAYFIPFLFYKSFDHSNEQNTNAQFFVDISSRNIRKNHLSFTMFIDEINFSNISKPDRQSNWWSFKGSWRYSDFAPNFFFTAEYTYTAPMVYKHFNPTTTYENTGFNMGYYLRDNSQEISVMLEWRPLPRLRTYINYAFANKGEDNPDDRVTKNPNTGLVVSLGRPFQEDVIWERHELGSGLEYQIVNGVNVALTYRFAKVSDSTMLYTAPYFQNSMHNVSFRLNIGI